MNNHSPSLIETISQSVTHFFGSWWAVILHTAWLIIWFSLRLSLEILMLWISLEAIFIWVVFLAASNRREEQRDRMGALQQIKIKEKMLDNLQNGEKHNQKLDHMMKMLYELQEQVGELKKKQSP